MGGGGSLLHFLMYVWYVQWYIFYYSFKKKRETYIGDKSGSEVRTEVYVVRSIIYMIEKERERRRRVGTIHILCMSCHAMPCLKSSPFQTYK